MFEIGNSLREARLRQGLEFPEVEQATKIRGKYLRALESEDFEQLPGQTYVKGFLRTYADYLGLDGQLYVDEYNSRYVTGAEDEVPLRVRRGGGGDWPRSSRLQSSAVLIALTAIGLAAALVIAAWKFGAADRPTDLPSAAPTAKKHKKPTRKRHQRQAPARSVPRFELIAKGGDSWLEVHRGSPIGRLEYQGTLYQGTTQRFEAKRLWVTVGAPWNLVVRVNGRRLRIPETSTAIDVEITKKGLKPVT